MDARRLASLKAMGIDLIEGWGPWEDWEDSLGDPNSATVDAASGMEDGP